MANTIATRSSALAIKKETTEGTPENVTGSTDFIALHDDFSMEPAFDTLENNELLDSIGSAKPELGLENPTVSGTHYFRNSGVEGQAPNYGELIEAALGQVNTAPSERDTVAGSTVSSINVDAGEGVDFVNRRPVLVKDPVNGYSVRWVESVSTDALAMSFNLPGAPASGVNTGDPVWYSPVSEGHPTLSFWHYLGNGGASGGAIQLETGVRVTALDVTADAGEYISMGYTGQGVSFYFNPVEITASNNTLDFTDDGGASVATIANQFYKDPSDLAEALQSAMNAASAETYAVSWSDVTGRFTISTSTSALLDLDFATGPNVANTIAPALGFAVADETGSLTYTSDNSRDLSSSFSPTFDAASPLVAKSNEVLLGDSTNTSCFAAATIAINVSNTVKDILSVCADSGKEASLINARDVTISLTARLERYQVSEFHRFHKGTQTRFQYTAGKKDGTNWTPGTVVSAYAPQCTITSWSISDDDGVAVLNAELTPYVSSDGNGEIYLGTL